MNGERIASRGESFAPVVNALTLAGNAFAQRGERLVMGGECTAPPGE
jgi:hypothetical protein